MYEANLLKTVEKNAVYRFRKTGSFVLVVGFCHIKKRGDEKESTLAVMYHPVTYIRIPSKTPHLDTSPTYGLQTKAVDQTEPFVCDEKEFRDNFYLHQSPKDRPRIISVIASDGAEAKLKKILNGDLVIA